MRFVCDGRVYVAADMILFRTPDPSVPSIYLTHDGRAAFVITCDPGGTLSAHRAATAEIIALARRYGLSGLLRAYPATFAPARILPESDSDLQGSELLHSDAEPLLTGTSRAGTQRAGVLT